ncbi:MAG: flagellar basal-body rod protein FlgG [Gammaproteobacteria bacterium]
MFDALYIAATGMHAHQSQVDVIANNVANLNTVGFRRGVVSFSEATAAVASVSQSDGVGPPGAASATSNGTLRGAGALAHAMLSMSGGELKQTGQSLDVAIEGAGFLEVVRPDGTPGYTRAGALSVNPDGLLALQDGTPLAGRIAVPPDAKEIRIDSDGTVLALVEGQTDPVEVGHIELASFGNPAALQGVGSNQFVATAQSGDARVGTPGQEGRGSVRQGFLESSNVQLVEEMVAMMLAQRAFELDGRVVQAADQMMSITNDLYRT